ncbi:hypothetical protein ABNG02_15240 [Halorubrum ejinorense]|uniref:Uncharacterized protein n=1 Tax=Halorubrum ejinorense TaxID=425309 RepID=A0AAV3SQU4_9EURY
MTELRHFLASLYDAVSEAEMQALLNGRRRLRRMVESGEFADDVSLPVYHATDLSVTLDVGLEARETKRGIQMFVTEPSADDQTGLELDLEVYDFLQAGDLTAATDDPKRHEGGLDVHIPLREPPVDSGDAVDSARDTDEKSEDTRKQARGRREPTEDERSEDERTDDEHGARKPTTDESTKRERTEDERTEDERAEDERTKEDRPTGERDKDERDKDADAAEKRAEHKRERLRKPAKFPGLSLPREWARTRGNRDAEEDER